MGYFIINKREGDPGTGLYNYQRPHGERDMATGRAEDKGYGDCGTDDGGGTTKSIGARDLPKTDFNCVRQKLQIHGTTHDTIARECEGARRT